MIDANTPQLRDPLYWPMTQIIHTKAMESMDNRAKVEMGEVKGGVDIADVHGQAVKNYPTFERLIGGAADFLNWIGRPLQGRGADLGSGTGVGACITAKMPRVSEVYAVECSELFVTDVMPEVFNKFSGPVEKIQRVVGDFNALHVADESLDFLVEIDSYHHSEDLALSARESFRVLKPGGVVIAVDRGWPDHVPQAELDAKLDKEFNPNLKRKYGIPENARFTRRDWGEHEYTFRQWESVFQENGFESIAFIQRRPYIRGSNFLLTRIPSLKISYWLASRFYRKEQGGRFPIYGWAPQQVVFIFIKKA
jgi:SAM-dependent methyltransferase